MPNRLSFTKLQADTITTRLGIVQERVIPSKRGSILVGTTETQKIVLKIADINNRATEEGITPSRSWGICNEARIISKLPNHIAPKLLHHAIDPNGLIYSVISYIDPCEDRPTANINLLKDYFSRLIAAVTDMHKSGIIHGDIQPDNVIFSTSANNIAKTSLVDFEFSRPFDSVDQTYPGSYHYLSPENAARLLNEEKVVTDVRDEIFAMAATCLTILKQSIYPMDYAKNTKTREERLKQIADGVYSFDGVEKQSISFAGKLVQIMNLPDKKRPKTALALAEALSLKTDSLAP